MGLTELEINHHANPHNHGNQGSDSIVFYRRVGVERRCGIDSNKFYFVLLSAIEMQYNSGNYCIWRLLKVKNDN
jgi:hypothetical protein